MATIVRATIPAAGFVLERTLAELPEAELETERIVEAGGGTVMPLLWVRGVDVDAFRAATESDPSVEDVTLLAEFEDELLFRMHWVDRVELLVQMITNSQASILDAYAADDYWALRVLYPTRDALSETQSFCDTHNLTFEVEAVREMEGEPTGRYGLTEEQHEALVRAVERGYFEVPRDTDLADLADELGISHQALSERIRRGSEALVEDTLMVGRDADRRR